ncbi:GNAT family N-acetyltransferase [Micrococcus terreus]|uniref:GNAT family N-acetyltransferase n=1 Tax=Micrococcus terreus TaxID=574650 RepID=UPI0033E30E21
MTSALNDALVSTWVTGWARCREYEVRHDGRIHAALRVGDEDGAVGDWEYVLFDPQLEELTAVAKEVEQHPHRLLTIVGTPHAQAQMTSLQPLTSGEKLMVVDMTAQDVENPLVPEEYEAVVDRHDGWFLLTIQTSEHHPDGPGVAAARGRVAAVDRHAVFDRIWTSPDFRRRGLGSLVMRYLVSLVLEHDVEEGLLVASADGQALYGYLGWTELADVTVLGVAEDHTADNPSHSDDR